MSVTTSTNEVSPTSSLIFTRYVFKKVKKNVNKIILSMCDVKVFLTFTFTEYGTVLTAVLPILFLYLNTVIVTAGVFQP